MASRPGFCKDAAINANGPQPFWQFISLIGLLINPANTLQRKLLKTQDCLSAPRRLTPASQWLHNSHVLNEKLMIGKHADYRKCPIKRKFDATMARRERLCVKAQLLIPHVGVNIGPPDSKGRSIIAQYTLFICFENRSDCWWMRWTNHFKSLPGYSLVSNHSVILQSHNEFGLIWVDK